jgi:hypothetical protein
MQLFPTNASTSVPPSGSGSEFPRQTADRTYKVFTVAAILLVLGSLWMF